MNVVTVVGARPQFIKAAAVSRALRTRHREYLVHTGQHYDREMSEAFFEELEIPAPDHHLNVGSGTHGAQTGAMLHGIEKVLLEQRPDWVLVYGDTNSTLAGALAGAKLHIPVAHVEAGLRSFNRRMPEEINRVLTDHVASLLFCPSTVAVEQLRAEGIVSGVYDVGDVMFEALEHARLRAAARSDVLQRHRLAAREYVLVTMHREENTGDGRAIAGVFAALGDFGAPSLLVTHPRLRKLLAATRVTAPSNVSTIGPLGYLDMVRATAEARVVLTDSGGLQKEAYWLGVPCVTLRDETEWVETVATGWNQLAGTSRAQILSALRQSNTPGARPTLYGDGQACARISMLIEDARAGAA